MDQTLNEKDILEKWKNEIGAAKSTRLTFERQWYINLAFYAGRQWIALDNVSGTLSASARLIEPPAPRHRVRLTINRIRPIVRRELARMNKEKIRGYVIASTTDEADAAAARAAEKLSSYLIDQTKLYRIMKRADLWMIFCGTSFVKDFWNPGADDPGALIPGTKGRIAVEAVSPFHIFVPNVDEPELDNQAWVCHAAVKSAQEIFELYGVDVSKDQETLATNTVESKLQQAFGSSAQYQKKGTEVWECWVKPNREYPDGVVITWTKSQILSMVPWPYAHKEYPFTKRTYVDSGRFYGDSMITDLIPLQVEYNKSRSQIIESKNRMSRPQLMAPKGSIDPRKMTSEPGAIIEYTPGFNPPTPLPLQPLPGYVLDNIQSLRAEFDDISSQFEISQGRVPPNIEAATAIAYLQENQDSVIADTLRDKELAWERVIGHFLSHVAQYWDAQRMVKTTGANANFEAFTFAGSDLAGNTDWKVVPGSATPLSQAAKQAQIMELMKMGAIPYEKGLQYLDMPDTAKLYEEMMIDLREAERENLKMARGVPVPVEDWQEDLIHIRAHDSYRKREEFENADPQIKAMMRQHVFKHMLSVATKMGQQIQIPPTYAQIMQQDPTFVPVEMEGPLRSFITEIMAAGGQQNAVGSG